MGDVKAPFFSLSQHLFYTKKCGAILLRQFRPYGATSMKRIRLLACTAAALTLSSFASATPVGPYIGIGVGQGQVKTPNKYAFNVSADPAGSTTRSQNGVAGRAFIGYNLNKYFGLEAGYTKYSRSIYVGRANGLYSSIAYYIHTYDFVGKGYVPVGDTGFNLYALAGVSRIVQTINFVNNGVPLSGALFQQPNNSNHVYRNRPIYGLGINYNFMKHLIANVEVTHVQYMNSFSNTQNATPSLDMYTLNLAYSFC
jgi:hypothetical protein